MYRSWLFVPGNSKEKLAKATQRGADAVIFDLEDGVAANAKLESRNIVAAALASQGQTPFYVRVNRIDTDLVEDDVAATLSPALAGYFLPKIERPEEIVRFLDLVERVKRKYGLETGPLEVVPLLETACGIENAFAIAAAHPCVRRVAFGALDLALELGVDVLDPSLAQYVRARIVIASRAARIEPPIDSVHPEFRVLEPFVSEAQAARRMGFGGKLTIHPNQVAIVNQVFQPSEQQRLEAARIVSAYEEAMAKGVGAIEVDGQMVDLPVYEKARLILKQSSVSE